MTTTLTRLYHFAASHRLHLPQLSELENTALFGKCNNPFGHGHDYVLSVTVGGDVDPVTGLMVQVKALDQLVKDQVLTLFSHRNINQDVPQFQSRVATTENVAAVIAEILQASWAPFWKNGHVLLHAVHVQETDRNGFEVSIQPPDRDLTDLQSSESIYTNA